jgi:hypothetical protein
VFENMECVEKYIVFIKNKINGHQFYLFEDRDAAQKFAKGASSMPNEDEEWQFLDEWGWVQPVLVTFSDSGTQTLLALDGIALPVKKYTLYRVNVRVTVPINYDHSCNNDEIPWLLKLATKENDGSMLKGLLKTFPEMKLYLN